MTDQQEPGSLSEEAARLVGALQQWLGGGRRKAEVTDDVWAQATTEASEPGHAPECASCPICRSIRFARDIDPETVERFVDAAAAMVAALQNSRRQDPPKPRREEPPADGPTWD